MTFIVFCAVSSGTYLVNDLFDIEQDRLHPHKRKRPIASGELSINSARLSACLLLVGGSALSLLVSWPVTIIVLSYLFLQTLYNISFKHLLILDIMTLASGFVLRAVAGALAAEVPMSPWFLFCVALLAFYIGLEKRKIELKRVEGGGIVTRKILSEYSLPYLEKIETAVLAALLLGYSLWTIEAAHTRWMMVSVPFVFYGLLRYQYLSGEELVERPEEALFKDRPLLLAIVLWVLVCFTVLAVEHLRGQ